MNTKNFNFFERHVEKLALAVAAAGAAYMVLLAYQPLTVDGKKEVVKVEDDVQSAVQKLEDARKKSLAREKIHPRIEDLSGKYRLQETKPLPDNQATLLAVPFVPKQAPVVRTDIREPDIGSGLVLTPPVNPPTNLTAVAWRGPVLPPGTVVGPGAPPPPPQPQPGAIPPGSALALGAQPNKDQDLVVIQGVLTLNEFANFMSTVQKIPEKLPREWQRTALYRVETERRGRPANNSGVGSAWGAWEPVLPNNRPDLGGAAFTDKEWAQLATINELDPYITAIQENFIRIAQPDSYLTVDGRRVLELLLKGIVFPGGPGQPSTGPAILAPSTTPAAGGPGAGGPGAGGTVAGGQPAGGFAPNGPGSSGPGASGPPGAGGGPAGGPPAAAANAVQPELPFWVADDTVQPGVEYQYRCRLAMYNPTFHWNKQLAKPAMKDQPLIFSDWVVVPNTVGVKPDMYFFVSGTADQGKKIYVQVYKYLSGRWLEGSGYTSVGGPIIGNLRGPDGKNVVVETQHILVDFTEGSTVDAIIQSPYGNLATRNSKIDTDSPDHKWVSEQVAAGRPPVVPPPPKPGTTPPGGMTPPGPGPVGGTTPPGPAPVAPQPTPPQPRTPPRQPPSYPTGGGGSPPPVDRPGGESKQ